MNDTIKIKSLSKDFAEAERILLDETPTTALFFQPEIASDKIRGKLVRFKKNKDLSFEKMQEKDFRRLKVDEGVYIDLSIDSLGALCGHVKKIQAISDPREIFRGEHEYVVHEKGNLLEINDENKRIIFERILSRKYTPDFWKILEDSEPDLLERLISGRLQSQRKIVIEELKIRLANSYHETKGESSWQNWIYKNSWLFGANYNQPIQKQKITIEGIMPDYLFPTFDNFVDILEIKLPIDEVITEDRNHKGSWIWTNESNKAIGQVVTYLNGIDEFKVHLEKSIKNAYRIDVSLSKPRAFILIGNSDDWSPQKREGLRKLNHSLHGIEILTYSDLLRIGEAFLSRSGEPYEI